MTILKEALKGNLTNEMIKVSEEEKIAPKEILKRISKGQAVIMKRLNGKHVGIGLPLRTKINVNLGTSSSTIDVNNELEKVKIAQKYGADTISDLSMGGDIDIIRKKILHNSAIPITTIPIYQAVVEANSLTNISEDLIFRVIEKQINDGISSVVIHAGFSIENLNRMKGKRVMGMVSKGGCFTASIMDSNQIENPFLKYYDYLLEMVKEKDIVINLGNAMRSGCIHDRIDESQIAEIIMNNKLAKIANEQGIQVILESLGGHLNAKDLMDWIKIHKNL
ncbi:MAG: phosphomethylpyrimidine synthase ThiC, partial [Promethearchaeota archaeon]